MVAAENYTVMLDCYRSGQMTDAELLAWMDSDDLFRVWILEHLRRPEGDE